MLCTASSVTSSEYACHGPGRGCRRIRSNTHATKSKARMERIADVFKKPKLKTENRSGCRKLLLPISGTHAPLKEFRKRPEKANIKTQTPPMRNENPTLRVRILCAAFVTRRGLAPSTCIQTQNQRLERKKKSNSEVIPLIGHAD